MEKWSTNEVQGLYGVGLWKKIRRGWGKFFARIRFEVGDGSKIRLWHDTWCGDWVIKEVFLDVYHVAHAKEHSMGDDLEILGNALLISVLAS